MSESGQLSSVDNQPSIPVRPRSRIRRLGCGIALVLWILLLLFPCLAVVLISQGEIAIQLGNIPGQSFRVWLIQDAKERGLGIARPSVHSSAEGANVCLQTDTSFILWMGSGPPSSYCECYTHSSDNWTSTGTTQGSCNP